MLREEPVWQSLGLAGQAPVRLWLVGTVVISLDFKLWFPYKGGTAYKNT